MPHFFISSKSVNNNEITVSDKENYNHIIKSLRAKIGEELLFIDENKIEYKTKLAVVENKQFVAEILSSAKSERDLSYNIYLAQSPLKSDAQNLIIEKATELGVRGIYPVYTDNCAVKKTVVQNKIEKWGKIMYEASKQCERANIPTCFDLTSLKELLNNKNFDRIIALCEPERNSDKPVNQTLLKDYLKNNSVKQGENILVIIGPEGGFSHSEFEMMRNNNLPMLSLGDLILKAETAVIVALGNIIYEFGR